MTVLIRRSNGVVRGVRGGWVLAVVIVLFTLSLDMSGLDTSMARGGTPDPAAAHGVLAFFFDSRSSAQAPSRVYAMGSNGSHRRAIAPPGSLMGAVSPDRRRLVYWQASTTAAYLVVADLDGRHARNVTSLKGFSYQPDWSPDGRQLAFGRGLGGAHTGLYVAAPTGGQLRPIPNTSEGTSPRYFPDGRHVVYMRGLNPCCLMYVIGADGRGKRAVAAGRLGSFLDVSPDGSTLVFQVNRRTGSASVPDGLATQSTSGGPVRRLTGAGRCAKSPRWAPDGAVVFFISCQRSSTGAYRFGHDSLAMVSADGSHAEVVVPNLVEAASLRWLAAPSAPAAATRTPASSPAAGVLPTSSSAGTTPTARPRSTPASSASSAHKASGTAAIAVAVALVALTGAGQVLARRRGT